MWQNWQHIISEEAKKYGYGEDRILRESKIKAAAEAWFNSLPKECLAELKQRVGKAIAAANTKNVPLLPTDLMNIQLILKAHKVKPLLGSMQASMTAVETMMQPDRLESLELESVEDENIITEGYERIVINTLEDAGFKRGDAWFDDGILYVAKRNLIAAAKTALQDNRNIYKLPKIKLNPDMKESIEEDGEELTEAPYKTSRGTPKFVGKYQFTPFVEGSISGWFLSVKGFSKEVGFIEKPARKITKTSVAPYKVYFHTEVSGHPEHKAYAFPGNETRVIQSNQFRFAPKQLLKGVAMWMDAYGYRMVGEETVSEAVGNTDKGGYSHWTNHTKVIRFFSWMHKKTGRSVLTGGDGLPWLTPAEKSEWSEHAYNGYFVFYNTVNGTTFGGMYATEQKAQAALDNAKRDHQKEVAKYVTAPQVRKRIQELENEIVGIRNSPSLPAGAVAIGRFEDEIKRLKQQLRSLGVKRESVEVDGDTIAEGRDYYAIEGTVDNQAGGAQTAPTMQEAEHYAKAMLAYLKKQSPKAKKITVHIFKVVNYERKDTPEKVLTVAEGIGDDINEAKKKLTSDQKAALKAYKLSCDMRDRDDITPDAYRHYEKRAKADAEACKKLGLGKEDGVYESVEVAEASGHWLRNSKRSVLGAFTHATTGVRFDYRMSDDEYGKKHGLPHEVHVGANSASGETRPALVKGTVCIIGVDEGADGKPVVEKWKIKQHVIYPIHNFRVAEKPEKWTKWRARNYRGEEFESEDTSLIEATYNKAKAKNRKKIVDGIKKVLNGEMSKQDFMRLIGAESEDHPMVVKTMAKMKDLVAKRTTIQLKAK